jgi:diadenosine tetraphosphate (Ap4A) HIT family hydrolase
MTATDCLICSKHRGEIAQPPGGYVYTDAHWQVCHAPVDRGPLGTLFIESRRHVLDFSEFNDAEAATFGMVLRKTYAALRPLLGVPRLYLVFLVEGVPHFHAWIVGRPADASERGIAFLAADHRCTEEQAVDLARRLRLALT